MRKKKAPAGDPRLLRPEMLKGATVIWSNVPQADPPRWMEGFGELKHLRKETARIQARIEAYNAQEDIFAEQLREVKAPPSKPHPLKAREARTKRPNISPRKIAQKNSPARDSKASPRKTPKKPAPAEAPQRSRRRKAPRA